MRGLVWTSTGKAVNCWTLKIDFFSAHPLPKISAPIYGRFIGDSTGIPREETKGWFCRRAVLANVPSFRFFGTVVPFFVPLFWFLVPSFRFLYPRSGFWYRRAVLFLYPHSGFWGPGTPPFRQPPFCEPPNSAMLNCA